MGKIFAHPFRIGPGGSSVTLDEASDAATQQLIAAVILTRRGERPLLPTFGIDDPRYGRIEPAQVAAVVAAHGPRVKITELSSTFSDSVTQEIFLTYAPEDSANA